MKTYVVNLPQSLDRRENILAECARFGLEPEIFPAVYGKNLTDEELRARVDSLALEVFSKGEIGCCLSHLGIYRDMIGKDIPVAFILEDDAVFKHDPRPVFDSLAQLAAASSPDVYLLTRLANQYVDCGATPEIGGRRFLRGWRGFGTHGYAITQKAAMNILALQTPMKFACDWWKVFRTFGILRLFLCDTEIVGTHRELAQASTIESERPAGQGRSRKKYTLRQTPLRFTAKYYLDKLRHWRRIKNLT